MTEQKFDCRTSINKLPRFWDRDVIFLANILSIFFGNTAETEVLRREVGALETYGGRLVPIIDLIFPKQGNLLVLERAPDKALLDYFRGLGLTLPELRVLPRDFYSKFPGEERHILDFVQELKGHDAHYVSGYVTDERIVHLAERLGKEVVGSVEGSRRGNNKRLLHDYLERNGFPVFDTFEAVNAGAVAGAFKNLSALGYSSAVIKAQLGASGIGMKRADIAAGTADLQEYMFFEGPVLVQGWLDESVADVKYVSSPSIQLFVDTEVCWLYDLTEQILSGDSVHEGNVAPPPSLAGHPELGERMMEQAHGAGTWLAAQGYRGTASIDFHIIERKGAFEVRVCEINARVTGATYPSLLAKHLLPNHNWLMRNIRFSSPHEGAKILDMLTDDAVLFKQGSEGGVLPFNFNMHSPGQVEKAQFLFLAQDLPGVEQMVAQVRETLADNGVYDRD